VECIAIPEHWTIVVALLTVTGICSRKLRLTKEKYTMKILACGDQHLTAKKPKNRLDDYYKTVLRKFTEEFEIAREEGAKFIIFPGDVFDSFKEGHGIAQDIMGIMQKFSDVIPLCVAGQHDQQFHNPDLRGTTLGTLLKSKLLTMLGKDPLFTTHEKVAIYGASWKDEIPEIITPDCYNILVLHKMIVDEKLWAEQEGHTWANHLLIKSKFDAIISGDNHKQFLVSKSERHLINMGAMMRSSIAQVEHNPAVCVMDTRTRSVEFIDLDVKPITEVMCVDKAGKEKERNEKLEAFVTSLKDTNLHGQEIKLNFVSALEDYVTKHKIDEDVSDIIFSNLE
jgi:DNA repair exonuclease SbcCD nuclease subunit